MYFYASNKWKLNHIITIRYFNPILKIGLQDVRNAWYLADQTPIQLTTILFTRERYISGFLVQENG